MFWNKYKIVQSKASLHGKAVHKNSKFVLPLFLKFYFKTVLNDSSKINQYRFYAESNHAPRHRGSFSNLLDYWLVSLEYISHMVGLFRYFPKIDNALKSYAFCFKMTGS